MRSAIFREDEKQLRTLNDDGRILPPGELEVPVEWLEGLAAGPGGIS